jgi:hypothetical protein
MVPAYKFILCDSSDTEIGEVEQGKNRVWTRFLSDWGEASFWLKFDNPKISLITVRSTRLKITRNGTTVWYGEIDYRQPSQDGITYTASSLEELLRYYLVSPDNEASGSARKFTDKAPGTQITQVLFGEATGKTGSKLSGVTTGTIENPTGATSAVTFTFDYQDTYTAIQTMAQIGSCDWEIVPQTRTFNFYRRKGTDISNFELYLDDKQPSNLMNFVGREDGRAIANKVYGFAAGVGVNYLKEVQTDSSSTGTYGLLEQAMYFKDVDTSGALSGKVADYLKTSKDLSKDFSGKLSTDVEPLVDWYLGDNINVNINWGSVSYAERRRVIGLKVSIADNGAESTDLFLDSTKS